MRHCPKDPGVDQRIGRFGKAALLLKVADRMGITAVAEITAPNGYGVARGPDAPFGVDVIDPELDPATVIPARGVEHNHVVYPDLADTGHPERPERNILPEFEFLVDTCPGNKLVDQDAVADDQRRGHRIGRDDELVANENP